MDSSPAVATLERPYDILAPDRQTLPLVLSSPHSGANYPDAFVAGSRLDPVTLRASEDSFVDQIFLAAPELGAPLLRAHFPRAYVDPNREPYELDPQMFDGPLPSYANTASPRVAGGLGTIARVVANGAEIYESKLSVAEALHRIETLYFPYHQALAGLIEETREQFGYCILVDCHSMPSVGGPMDRDPGRRRVEIVLGDAYGASCAGVILTEADAALSESGYLVARNTPYSGGFVTRHYGRPKERVHALQIEINRALYMDEALIQPRPSMTRVREHMRGLIRRLGAIDPGDLRP